MFEDREASIDNTSQNGWPFHKSGRLCLLPGMVCLVYVGKNLHNYDMYETVLMSVHEKVCEIDPDYDVAAGACSHP